MKTIINPWMFYLVDCLDGLKMVCIIAVPVLVIVIAILSYIIDDLGLDIDDYGLNKERGLNAPFPYLHIDLTKLHISRYNSGYNSLNNLLPPQ